MTSRLLDTRCRGGEARAKTDGTAKFGIDSRVDGMQFAVVARCPVFGGKMKSFDAAKATAGRRRARSVCDRTGRPRRVHGRRRGDCGRQFVGGDAGAESAASGVGTRAACRRVVGNASQAISGQCRQAGLKPFAMTVTRTRSLLRPAKKSKRPTSSFCRARDDGADELYGIHRARQCGSLGADASAAVGDGRDCGRLETAEGKDHGSHDADGRRFWTGATWVIS